MLTTEVTMNRDNTMDRAPGVQRDGAPPRAARMLAWLGVAVSIALAPALYAATYKWVDDQGVVHYSDKLPPEAINKGSVELNKQGVPVKRTDPALSPEQRRVHDAEEERARQAARIREEIQRKDRALLQSYTNESEIELSKKRALGTIEGQMQSAQAFTVTLNKRKQEIMTRIASFGDKPKPASLDTELTNVNDEIAKQEDLIATKRKESTAVTARYDADKKRWQELRTIAEADATAANSAGPTMPTSTKK
jgi:Domain of unknown function (DUF4124)